MSRIVVSAPGYYAAYHGASTFAPGMYPTWVPGIVPTPAPGMTYAPGGNPFSGHSTTDKQLQEAKRTRENFPETWVWETVISGYVCF